MRRKNSVDAVSEQSADIKQHDLTDKVIIRTIEPQDKEPARELLKAHHASTIYADYAFSDDKFETHAAAIYAYPEHMVCLVAELNGEIVGLVWASAGSYSLSDELILATCQVIAVHPTKLGRLKRVKTFLRLIKGVKTWSDTRGAHQVLVHVTTGTNLEATDRLLRRSGAKCIGGGYVV
ncbi:GNAT family N-acetyltransferase [Lentilitoribacter sp. EG35]|uniref:GNAT family N-acetyltransferase n=1 Tax=Lentilitoribacter sp. EG35 TaxID=3234192 RepID=UPI00345F2E13